MRQRRDQGGAGVLAARQRADLLSRVEAEVVAQARRVAGVPARIEGRRVAHQLADGHPPRQAALLREVADSAEHAGGVAHRVEAEDPHPPALGAQQAQQMLDERRLAGAVLADEPEHHAALENEIHLVQRGLVAELARELLDRDHRIGDSGTGDRVREG